MNIGFLLDKSGSMHPQSDDAIGSFNSFVEAQPDGTVLSLWTFSDDLKSVFKDMPVRDVEPLTTANYRPSGGTALYDAMGEVLKGLTAGSRLIVLTDGQENSSIQYTKEHVRDLIKLTGIDVIYAGVDLEDARDLGIRRVFKYDGTNTPDIMTTLSQEATRN